MLDQGNLPAQLRNLRDVVAEYDAKVEAIDDRIAAFEDVVTAVESSATVGGTYVGSIWGLGPRVLQRRFGEHHVHDKSDFAAHLLCCWVNTLNFGSVNRP